MNYITVFVDKTVGYMNYNMNISIDKDNYSKYSL